MGRHANSFDLLRLLAATQVLLIHEYVDLHVPYGPVATIASAVPGVPIFFVISGFLVSESYARSSPRDYFVKRALRIYPALWACLGVSLAIAVAFGVRPDWHVWPWLLAQATIVQFYNPDFLRHFGVGVINGSLWTIPVELQFYLTVPFLKRLSTRTLMVLIVIGIVVNRLYARWGWIDDTFAKKFVGVTLAPWLYFFLLGALFQRVKQWPRLAWALPAFVTLQIALYALGANTGGNFINPLSGIALAVLVISAAHARAIQLPGDISYGLYLFHMPVLNAVRNAGCTGWLGALIVTPIAVALAVLSWIGVERPALSLRGSWTARASFAPPPLGRSG